VGKALRAADDRRVDVCNVQPVTCVGAAELLHESKAACPHHSVRRASAHGPVSTSTGAYTTSSTARHTCHGAPLTPLQCTAAAAACRLLSAWLHWLSAGGSCVAPATWRAAWASFRPRTNADLTFACEQHFKMHCVYTMYMVD
jgi:hypothetical protein